MFIKYLSSSLFIFIFIHSPLSPFAQESSLDSEISKTKEVLLIDLKVMRFLTNILLNDESPHMRKVSAYALGEIKPKDPKIIDILREVLLKSISKDENYEVRKASFEALKKIESIQFARAVRRVKEIFGKYLKAGVFREGRRR